MFKRQKARFPCAAWRCVFSVQKARFPCAAWRCAFGVAKGKRQGSRVPLSFNVPYMKCGDGGAEAPASAARAHRLTARAHRLTI